MVKRTQHIGTFLHNEMGISIGGISPMCGRSSIQRQKIFFLKPIAAAIGRRLYIEERNGALFGDDLGRVILPCSSEDTA